jgi:uncharacterized iron-regulated protein
MSAPFCLPAFARHFFCVFVATLSLTLVGCAHERPTTALQSRINAWLPADVLLLGEQHDAPEHQALQQQIVEALAAQGVLAAVALEMADSGNSTATLPPDASEEQTRAALNWDNDAWPWAAYGPAVMSAVRAGVTVLGANLPRAQMLSSMADVTLDQRLTGPALKAQQQLIRQGHCNLLPDTQITPMTRIQIAKDMRMAQTVQSVVRRRQVVLMISGSVHADKQLGVPQHLPPALSVKAVRLQAGTTGSEGESFDGVWLTPATPDRDYCADLEKQLPQRSPP